MEDCHKTHGGAGGRSHPDGFRTVLGPGPGSGGGTGAGGTGASGGGSGAVGTGVSGGSTGVAAATPDRPVL